MDIEKERTYTIYRITCCVNQKCYVGQSVNIKRRISTHKRMLKKGIHENTHMQNSFDLYGSGSFKFEILEENIDINIIDERERFYIAYYNSMNREFGFNKESGGSLNKKVSEELKKYNTINKSGAKNHNAKAVKNIKTGEVFVTVKEAAISMNMDKRLLSFRLNGNTRNDTDLRFIDASGIVIETDYNVYDSSVKNIKTGEIFLRVKDAAKSIKIAVGTLCAKLNGRIKNNTDFQYINNNRLSNSKETREKISEANSGKKNRCAKAVKNIKTGEIYSTLKELCDSIGVKSSTLCQKINGARKNNTDFRYIDNSGAIIEKGYKPQINSCFRAVKNTETGEIFPTIASAAKSIGMGAGTLGNKLRGQRKNDTTLIFTCEDSHSLSLTNESLAT